jgi:hypothetical protein
MMRLASGFPPNCAPGAIHGSTVTRLPRRGHPDCLLLTPQLLNRARDALVQSEALTAAPSVMSAVIRLRRSTARGNR